MKSGKRNFVISAGQFPFNSGLCINTRVRSKDVSCFPPEENGEFLTMSNFHPQVSAVREGMGRVVPVPLLSLFTGPELETMICGSPDIPLDLLKSVVTYKGVDASAPLVRWFWETLESFSNAERSLFLRFVWGRTRLPRTIVDFRGRDFVFQVSHPCDAT